MTFLPNEHGAYGQMVLPLFTALVVADVTAAAALVALSVTAGFLAHEPLSIILGRRGPRASRDDGHHAALWLAFAGITALVSGLAAFWMVPHGARWSFTLPLVPGTLVGLAIVARRQKSWLGEVSVALAFSLIGVPMALAAGAAPGTALTIGVAFALVFVAGTLAVRVIILKVRGGGHVRAVGATRCGLLAVVVAGVAGLGLAASGQGLLWISMLAAAPGLALAAGVARRAPSPARLHTVGWMLMAASGVAAVILVAALHTN